MDEEALHKVVIVGDSGVGKTSIIFKKLGKLNSPYQSVGAGCFEIRVPIDGEDVRLNVWDTAGQEAYHCLIPLYARDARFGIVVYDQTRIETFDHLEYWIKSLEDMNVPSIVVVGNKTDCPAVIDDLQASEFCSRKNLMLFHTSICNEGSIAKLFQSIASTCQSTPGLSSKGAKAGLGKSQTKSTCC